MGLLADSPISETGFIGAMAAASSSVFPDTSGGKVAGLNASYVSGGWYGGCGWSPLSLKLRFLARTTQNPIPTSIASPPTPAPTPIPAFAPVLSDAVVSAGVVTMLEDEIGSVTFDAGDVDDLVVDSGPRDMKVVGV